jgi:hypothetical protein
LVAASLAIGGVAMMAQLYRILEMLIANAVTLADHNIWIWCGAEDSARCLGL